MSFLALIRPQKEREAAALRTRFAARAPERTGPAPRDFAAALRGGRRLIAEVKRRSPSDPEFRREAAVDRLAAVYERSGAAAVSIVTDKTNFGTSLDDVAALRTAVTVPVLAKDFVLDETQILAAWAAGADAVLLIARFVPAERLAELLAVIHGLGLESLVECHDEADVANALAAGAKVLGLNNRDLAALTTDLDLTSRLLPMVPPGLLTVSESGIGRREQIVRLADAGADAFLIGHALLKHRDPGRKVRQLTGREPETGPLLKVCGLTTVGDAEMAVMAGAHILGLIFADSPRQVTAARAAAIRCALPEARLCGVFKDEDPGVVTARAETCSLDLVQLHGNESPTECRDIHNRTGLPVIKAFSPGSPALDRIDEFETAYLLLDLPKHKRPDAASGGLDPGLLARAKRLRADGHEVLLAGGITPRNVREALAAAPAGVDVCRGVETSPGRKDPTLLAALGKEVSP